MKIIKRECSRRDESEIEINWKSCREDDDDQINIIKFITWNHGDIKECINQVNLKKIDIRLNGKKLYHTHGRLNLVVWNYHKYFGSYLWLKISLKFTKLLYFFDIQIAMNFPIKKTFYYFREATRHAKKTIFRYHVPIVHK